MPPRQSEIDHWRKQYEHEVGFFYPDLPVSHIYPEGDILTKRDLIVYRDVEQFVQHIRIKTDIHLEAGLIAHCCFRGAASEWFFGLLDFLQDYLTRDLDALCNRILQKFDTTKQKEEQERLQQQQAEEARIAKEKAEAFACRRCPAKFPSNTKLHQHIQDHHQKPTKPAGETAKSTPCEIAKPTPSELAETTPKAMATMPTPPATTPTPSEPALMLAPPIDQSKSTSDNSLPLTPPATPTATPRQSTPTSPATPKKPISWAEIASRPVIAPKPSRLPVPTPKRVPNIAETAPITCPPTPPPTPPQKPASKQQHPKTYLTIDDLFEMFAEKRTTSGLLHTKKSKSPPKLSNQTRITSYFRPAANQSKPISQGSKTPNPRSFQEHTLAESNRAKSLPPRMWSEKSAVLPYKSSIFSRLSTSEISSVSPYKLPVISGRLPRSATPRASFGISACSHACRICSGTFGSNNGLHRHLRAIHFNQAIRRHRRWII